MQIDPAPAPEITVACPMALRPKDWAFTFDRFLQSLEGIAEIEPP
jgi:hypothetical protein